MWRQFWFLSSMSMSWHVNLHMLLFPISLIKICRRFLVSRLALFVCMSLTRKSLVSHSLCICNQLNGVCLIRHPLVWKGSVQSVHVYRALTPLFTFSLLRWTVRCLVARGNAPPCLSPLASPTSRRRTSSKTLRTAWQCSKNTTSLTKRQRRYGWILVVLVAVIMFEMSTGALKRFVKLEIVMTMCACLYPGHGGGIEEPGGHEGDPVWD